MSTGNSCRKTVAIALIVAFAWLVHLSVLPARAADNDAPGAIEKTAPGKSAPKKKSILPWVLIGASAVAVAAVLVLVVFKNSEKLREDFTSSADAKWLPRTAAKWSVAGGAYVCESTQTGDPNTWWEWSLYNKAWSKPNFTVKAKMRVTKTSNGFGIMLTTGSDMHSGNMYQFLFWGDGQYKVRMMEGFDLYTSLIPTSSNTFRDWTAGAATANTWNEITIVKAGTTYSLTVNGTALFSFTDSKFDTRYVSIVGNSQVEALHLEVDYFNVDLD